MHDSFVVWFTGPSGSGKTTLAHLLNEELVQREFHAEILDGDIIRKHLSPDLGYDTHDRETNMRRIGFLCRMLMRHRIVAIVAAISPIQTIRDEIKSSCSGRFVEIGLQCSMEILVKRDVKGLYKRALAGEIKNFTGISAPYEEPLHPEITLDTEKDTPSLCKAKIVKRLQELGYLPHADPDPCNSSVAGYDA